MSYWREARYAGYAAGKGHQGFVGLVDGGDSVGRRHHRRRPSGDFGTGPAIAVADPRRGAWTGAGRPLLVRADGRESEHRAGRAALRRLPRLAQDAGVLLGQPADDAADGIAEDSQLREQ